MFSVHFINFGTTKEGFQTFEQACAECYRCCFEAIVYETKGTVHRATFSPISGITYRRRD